MKDSLIIIGGGAAGLCAAVAVKQKCPSMSVRILEALPRVGKKLSVTGNGRCNITNKNITLDRYYGKNTELAEYVLEKYDNAVIEDFFEKIGVDFVYEGDKAYPSSLQAGSVVDCLRFAADELGVITCTDTKVTNIQLSKDGYKIISDKMNFYADKLLIATGLLSGGEKYGCDGYIFELLKKSGFSANALNPAIVQVKTENEIVKQLKGIKIDAAVSLKSNGNIVRKDRGEVLFCDYGLSGPPVMQVSGAISQIKGQSAIYLDILPDMSYDSLYEKLKTRAKSLKGRNLDEFFTGMLNKRLGQVIVKMSGFKLSEPVSSLSGGDLIKIALKIKSMSFRVTGTTGFANSQVTAGGISLNEFDCKTMMSKSNKNLYAAGEILDIYGDCGGFNLRWAWSSALCAADSIAGGGRNDTDK